MDTSRDTYGQIFRRVRLEAVSRLANDAFDTLEGAAREIGISTNMLKAIEKGERRPSFETLQAMARAYNVMEGDLLPSSAPSGPEVAKIIGPLATLPNGTRGRFITQMAAFATILATEMNAIREISLAEITDRGEMRHNVTPSSAVQSKIQKQPIDYSDRPNTVGIREGQGQPAGDTNGLPTRRHSQKTSTTSIKGGRRS